MWGRWPSHAVSTEIRPGRAETHSILAGVMMDASILLPSSRAARAAGCWKYCCTHSTVHVHVPMLLPLVASSTTATKYM